ncbi:MAG: hypothetical protein OXC64_06565 [Flavobacteriaceae bacterium]|nr:hypothetical protein [Flavobacteriaceae bacterium]
MKPQKTKFLKSPQYNIVIIITPRIPLTPYFSLSSFEHANNSTLQKSIIIFFIEIEIN